MHSMRGGWSIAQRMRPPSLPPPVRALIPHHPLTPPPPVYRRQSELLSRRGVDASQLHVAFEVNSVEAVKNAVEEGIGVAFVSAAAAMRELKEGLLKEVGDRGWGGNDWGS